jgi:hypothetical protein
VETPLEIDGLLLDVSSLSLDRITALAANFEQAEASELRRARRALARHLALTPETPNCIGVLAGQLLLSEAMIAWETFYGLDDDLAYAARAAVLDMGLVLAVAMSPKNAEVLAAPWNAAVLS